MLNKLFSFLGFNAGETLVGLSHLTEDVVKNNMKAKDISPKKDVKLSDLMRGV